MKSIPSAILVAAALLAAPALAAEKNVSISKLNDDGRVGKEIGTVLFKDTATGVEIRPRLTGLPSGQHGFHIHENASCEAAKKDGKTVPGLAAGDHYDPKKAGAHHGPEGSGHLGDLPALKVNEEGKAEGVLQAPRLKVADLEGRALVIHSGGDNYSDKPKPLGGGGSRIACGTF